MGTTVRSEGTEASKTGTAVPSEGTTVGKKETEVPSEAGGGTSEVGVGTSRYPLPLQRRTGFPFW